MTTMPAQMINRWHDRDEPAAGQGTVYWHVLMSSYPEAVELAQLAQQRLARFSGLHMTPLHRLHMTTMIAGPADDLTHGQLGQMAAHAAERLSGLAPVHITLGWVIYHPEAIELAVTPAQALAPLRKAARTATRQVLGRDLPDDSETWHPHITICYSTAHQPAQPIIETLGKRLPEREIDIHALSLVIQHGPERRWDWSTAATIDLGDADRA